MSTLQIEGTIKQIGQTQTHGNFTKREFVIETKNGQYTDMVCLQFVKDKVSVLDNYRVGQNVRAHFNLASKEFNGKWFTNASCWKLESI